ncbi:MAG TPA: hypothetical protein VF490_19850 [Chryseosolibacter sp.]
MNPKTLYVFAIVASAALLSCSDSNESKRKGDADVPHEGTKWNIVSVDNYALTDVGMTGVVSKTGSLSNAGAFYFVDGDTKGSFEMTIEGYNKEDLFTYTKNASDSTVNIVNLDQSVGVTTNQNVLLLSGKQTSATQMTLDYVSIVKESSATGIFTLTATTIKLEKQ